MVYNVLFIKETEHIRGCYCKKGYRKDMKACIIAANNLIFKMPYKDATEIRVHISDTFGRILKQWKYFPTIR